MDNMKRTLDGKLLPEWAYMALIAICSVSFFSPQGLFYTQYAGAVRFFERGQKIIVALLIVVFILEMLTTIKRNGWAQVIALKRNQIIMDICVLIISGMQWISTVLNDGEVNLALLRIASIVSAYLTITVLVKTNPRKGLKVLTFVFATVMLVNLVVIIYLYPSGGFRGGGSFWLFGQKNAIRNIVYPTVTFMLINDRINRIRCSLITALFLIIGLVTFLIVDSKTSLSLYLLMMVLYFGLNFLKLEFLNLQKFIIGYIVLNILVVFVRNFSLVEFFVTQILEKDLTFTNRIYLWDQAIAGIENNFLVGKGLQGLRNVGLNIGKNYYVSHAHNALLDVLYKNGIFACVALIIIVYLCCKPIFENNNNMIASLCGIAIGSFLIAGIFGELWSYGFYIVLFFSYMLPDLLAQLNKREKQYVQKRKVVLIARRN